MAKYKISLESKIRLYVKGITVKQNQPKVLNLLRVL